MLRRFILALAVAVGAFAAAPSSSQAAPVGPSVQAGVDSALKTEKTYYYRRVYYAPRYRYRRVYRPRVVYYYPRRYRPVRYYYYRPYRPRRAFYYRW